MIYFKIKGLLWEGNCRSSRSCLPTVCVNHFLLLKAFIQANLNELPHSKQHYPDSYEEGYHANHNSLRSSSQIGICYACVYDRYQGECHYDTYQHFNKGVFLLWKTAAYPEMYSFATMCITYGCNG